ncbi:MAG: S24 family peptidase [Bacteroides sp.]|nr:S24 family peptidase [Bacteroides sp.]
METVKERLLEFLKQEGISKVAFARKMGLSDAYVSTMRKSLPEEKVVKMTQMFPRLNRDWLMYGEGDMYLPEEVEVDAGLNDYFVPLLPVQAFAGSLQEYSEGIDENRCLRIATPVKGADMAIPISGDSMEPEIHNGSVAVITRINEAAFIPWGNPMVLDTENGVLIKVLRESKKGPKYIEAVSYNPAYSPLDIPKSSIYGIYRINCILRQISTM